MMVGMSCSKIFGFFIRGTSNAVNALAVFKSLILDSGKYELNELIHGLDVKNQEVLCDIENVAKWGNDEDWVDELGCF